MPCGFVEDDFRLDRLGERPTGTQYAKEEVLSRSELNGLRGYTGGFGTVRDDRWEEGFDHLRRFVEREGHARVPVAFVGDDGYALGTWAAHQRVPAQEG